MSVRGVDIVVRVRHPAFTDLALHGAELPGTCAYRARPAGFVSRLRRHRDIESAPGRDMQYPLDTVLDALALRDHAARNADDGIARIPYLEELDTHPVEVLVDGRVLGRGSGTNRKRAEQAAAARALESFEQPDA